MKQLLSIFLVICVVFALSSCKHDNIDTNKNSDISLQDTNSEINNSSVAEASSKQLLTTPELSDNNNNKTQISAIPSNSQKAKKHTHSYTKEVTAPSCSQKGYTTYSCSCGEQYISNYTSPKHNFIDYICDKCSAIDKSHSFQYLSEWLLNNGTVFGDSAYIESNPTNNARISILYYPDSEFIAFETFEYDIQLTTMLFLWSDQASALYINGTEHCRIEGNITIKTYTSNSPISYESCQTGYPYNTELVFLEATRIDINYLLKEVNNMLLRNNIGITLSDLGFTSF